MEADFLKDLVVLFGVSIPLVLITTRLHLPPLIGFMMTGMAIGPFGFGVIENHQNIELLAEIGIILLLFTVGLEFSLQALGTIRKVMIGSGLSQMVLTVICCTLVGIGLGWSTGQSLFFGAAVSLSSTAVVLASLSHEKALSSLEGRVSTGILIFQDLAVIPLMALLPLLIQTTPSFPFALAKMGVLGGGIFILHYFVMNPLWRAVVHTRSRELMIVTLFAFAMGLGLVSEWLGLSYALGAFLGGLLLSATEYRYYALSEVLPLRHGFSALFFASIGMLLNLSFLAENFWMIFFLVLIIPLLKVVLTAFSIRLTGISWRVAVTVGLLLGQIGEFSFLLAQQGHKIGIFGDFFYQLVISFAAITLLATPLFARFALKGVFGFSPFRGISSPTEKKNGGASSLQNHVILCGFGPLGQTIGRLLTNHQIPCQIVEMNPQTFHALKEQGLAIQLGDGTSETMLMEAGISTARILAIAIPDHLDSAIMIQRARDIKPDLFIVARARFRHQSEHLYGAGADVVVCEELEGGIEMGRYLLQYLKYDESSIQASIKKIREFGSADFF